MWWLVVAYVFVGQLSPATSSACSESNGEGGSKTLSSPCPFIQIASDKKWDIAQLSKQTNIFFRFAEMNCQSYKEESAMISLKCSHTNQFYLMKPILSYGTSQNPSFTFKFASGGDITYNDTEITIKGQLSQALGAKTIKATKESGQTDFEFTTDTFSEINMENFINQRKDGAFRKLTLGEKLQTMPPRSASNAVMSATFSAINEDEDTPSNQNYELIISFGGTKSNQFYIFQKLIEENNYHISYYSAAKVKPREAIKNLGFQVKIPEGLSPAFDASKTAFSSSDGQMVIINKDSVRKIAEQYISQSSQAMILKGTFLYWHIDDPNSIKVLASNISAAEEPPTPTNETSSLYNSEGELITDDNKKNKKVQAQILIKESAKNAKAETKKKMRKEVTKLRSRRSPPSMSLDNYMSMANQYMNMASKRTEDETDFTDRDQMIALHAQFMEDSNMIEIKSPEYLKGGLNKVLQTFMPSFDIPQYASALSAVSVVFSKILVDISEQKISVHCNITQKFDLVKNLIDGNGLVIIATADLPTSSPQGRQEWEITGKGTTTVLQQLVMISLVPNTGYLYVKGPLEIANMTDFYSNTGNVDFLSKELKKQFPLLTNFALTKLKVATKIASEKLRLIGKCLIFAEPKTPEVEEAEERIGIEDENPEALTYESKIRIVLENKTSLEYVVGILGDDIPFTASIEHMFNSTVTSASWLKFKRIGILLSNTSMSENEFGQAVLQNFEIRPETSPLICRANQWTGFYKIGTSVRHERVKTFLGIHILATLLTPREDDCRKRKKVVTSPEVGEAAPSEGAEDTAENGDKRQTIEGQDDSGNETMMENNFCMFLMNNPTLVDYVGTIKGEVNETIYTFQAENMNKNFMTLFPDAGNPIEIRHVNFFLQVTHGEMDIVNLAIKGDVKIVFNGNTVIYKGLIGFDDTKGTMTLQLMETMLIEESPQKLPFSIRELGGGYSVLGKTSREFQRFMVKSKIRVGIVEDKMVEFAREPNFIFNVRDPSELYITAFIKNFENDDTKRRNALFEIFAAFGSNISTHVMLKDIQAEQLTGVVYSAKDADFQIEGVSERFKKGLNFYGTAKVLREKQQEFHIYYDSSSNTLMADIHLPYYQALSPDGKKKYPLIFKRNNMDDKIEGGKLVVTATKQETVVKFKGYIMVVGAGEQVECAVESDGKFRLVFSASSSGEPFKLFKESPCRYSIRQLDSASSFFKIDPKVQINLDASKVTIEQGLKGHLQKIIDDLTRVKTANRFNQYNVEVDGQVDTVKELMLATDNQMTSMVDSMDETVKELTTDCVAKCASKNLKIYGYRWENGKYVGDDNAHEVADVACIAECEMVKPVTEMQSETNIIQLATLRAEYEDLRKRAEIMQQYLDLHYTVLEDLSQQMKEVGKKASKLLDNIDEVVAKNDGEIDIKLQRIKLSKKISQIESRGNGSKCIKGFAATFEVFGKAAQTTNLDLCFNGEFGHYAAHTILNTHFGNATMKKYYEQMDQAADREKELMALTEFSVKLLRKIAKSDVNFEELLREVVSTAKGPVMSSVVQVYGTNNAADMDNNNTDDSINEVNLEIKQAKAKEIKEESKSKKNVLSKGLSQGYISYGGKTVIIPKLSPRVEKKLKTETHYTIKNPKTKQAFMYSSPWAAAKSLGLHKNGSFDHLVHFTAINKAALSKQQRNDMMYWVRQYENGVRLYSAVTEQKLLDHNYNGLKRWKYEMEGSLSKYGLGSFQNVLNQFQARSSNGIARSSLPNEQDEAFAQHFQYFSKGMIDLLQNPDLKLESITETAKAISHHFETISRNIPNCA